MKTNIDKLLLYMDNPRLLRSLSEQESLVNMIADQGNRLVVLGKSIIDNGLNPLEKIGVFPSQDYDGYYVVGEGNRRVCALKLLRDPSLCKEIDISIYRAFESLSSMYTGDGEIDVEVFDDFNSMRAWVEIIHMGEQGGKGTVRWNAQQKQRFEQRIKGKSLFADFFDMVVNENVLTREEILLVTVTNWERVITKRYYPFLFLKIVNDSLVFSRSKKNDFALRIRAIQEKLQGKSVDVVYNKEKVNAFYDDICMGLYGCNYDELLINESMGYADETEDNVEPNDSAKAQPNNIERPKEASDNQSSQAQDGISEQDVSYGAKIRNNGGNWSRDTIIPYSFKQRSSCVKVNKIIYELRRLHVDDYPNACAALLRLLFELAAKNYLKSIGQQGDSAVQFEAAIRGAANELRKRRVLSDSSHSKLMKDVDQMRKMFNEDMHDSDSFPTTEGLKNWFNAHHRFIEECLKEGK